MRSERELVATIPERLDWLWFLDYDPDASVTRRGKGKSKLKYQVHRSVDQKREFITATEVTLGEVHEAHLLESLIDTHEKNIRTSHTLWIPARTLAKAVARSDSGIPDGCDPKH